ncbi:sulfur oxidation c-type cytochrome SoxX [Fulvimarina sp. 2208YS6-2-32]|uniref:Sulfur oxidation c-type cytochrome SoxX n=1 Tax=Fulvimarina uroteuthidis TaxID=3098149 RepID=A0ABU5HYL2_9HYPH|nr:sulfur oxidation c-type cytochrome SoxX [Fulvimarina sp. 2208YS6-2-32]MDY8107982.1 sulfur oxidation c-type cytochrome SoxX [Fulvimarina sp. 2208YS6-2-32]
MKRVHMLASGLGVALLAAPAGAFAADIAPGDVAFSDMSVETPLSSEPGDPVAGREVFADRGLGNCLACHANSEIADAQFPGNVGPSMDGVADRWSAAQLRAILANAKAVFGPDTIMPGFYTLDVGVDVAEEFKGRTILSAGQVEDVVAYLTTLKDE